MGSYERVYLTWILYIMINIVNKTEKKNIWPNPEIRNYIEMDIMV